MGEKIDLFTFFTLNWDLQGCYDNVNYGLLYWRSEVVNCLSSERLAPSGMRAAGK